MPPSEDQWESVKGDWQTLINETQNSINRGVNLSIRLQIFTLKILMTKGCETSADKAFYALIPLASVPLLALLSYLLSLHSQRWPDCVCCPWFDIPRWVLVYKTAKHIQIKYRRPFRTSSQPDLPNCRGNYYRSWRPGILDLRFTLLRLVLKWQVWVFLYWSSVFVSILAEMIRIASASCFATSAGWQLAAISNSILRYATVFLESLSLQFQRRFGACLFQ